MMALVGTISFNFQVLLPLLADFTWHGTATTYALLTAAMGVGSVGRRAGRGRARARVAEAAGRLARCCSASSMLLAAAAPTLELQIAGAGAAGRGVGDVRGGRELARCRSRSSRRCAGA